MNRFITETDGAVTVDWVVLTAALVGVGIAAMLVISGGVEDLATDISNEMKREDGIIKTAFEPDTPAGPAGVEMNVQATHGFTVGARATTIFPTDLSPGEEVAFLIFEVPLEDGETVYRIEGATRDGIINHPDVVYGDPFVVWSDSPQGHLLDNDGNPIGNTVDAPPNADTLERPSWAAW